MRHNEINDKGLRGDARKGQECRDQGGDDHGIEEIDKDIFAMNIVLYVILSLFHTKMIGPFCLKMCTLSRPSIDNVKCFQTLYSCHLRLRYRQKTALGDCPENMKQQLKIDRIHHSDSASNVR